MSTPKLDTKAIAKAAKARMETLETYKTFKLETKLEEYEESKDALTEAHTNYRELINEINGYLQFAGMDLLPDETSSMDKDDLITKLEAIMSSFPTGANGKEIASKIGMGVTSNDISVLYWTEGQSTLKKTGQGLKTKYFLATASDLDDINKAKQAERAKREADKKEREAKKDK
jgi:hypothetical protein